MESEIGDHRSPRGGPGSEPTSQEQQPGSRVGLSRAAKPGSEATAPLTAPGWRDDATERAAEYPDQSGGGEALTAGRGGETELPPAAASPRVRMRGLSVQVAQEGYDALKCFQQHSRLPHNQFFGTALMIGAGVLLKMTRPDLKDDLAGLFKVDR